MNDILCNIEYDILDMLAHSDGAADVDGLVLGDPHRDEILNYLLFKQYIWSYALEGFNPEKTEITMKTLPTHYFITPKGLAAYYVERERREAERAAALNQNKADKQRFKLDLIAILISALALLSSILFGLFG